MKFTAIKTHFTNWREWEFNPIVIKELRQAVRSWAVTGMLLLFLVVMFITALAFLVGASIDNGSGNDQLGGFMFQAFLAILAFASVIFIPLYLGIRVAAERNDNNPDLLYISTLSPGRIIRGKFLCGAYMAVLFFSACMPFMAFTNLLRGVDLPSVFFILFCLFVVVCMANMVAIFFACLPISRPLKILLGLYGLIQSFWIVVPAVILSYQLMHGGIGATMGSADFWIGFLTYAGIVLVLMGFFYFLSVALISPPSANRALPVRAYVTIIWLLTGLLCLAWVPREGLDVLKPWIAFTFVLMIASLLVVISNNDQLSQRVRRGIPAGRLKRVLAFLLFNGAAGGLLWVLAVLTATFASVVLMVRFYPSPTPFNFFNSGGLDEFITFFPTFTAYVFAYALTALFFHRRFLSKRTPKLAGILAVFLAGLWALLPGIVLFFLNQLSWKSLEGLQLGNMFNVFVTHEPGQRFLHLIFAGGWLLVAALLNARWFITQARNFRPLRRDAAPPVLE